ncbi:3,4-dihydroxy-2-butanone-4-phosphate synthase [Nocardia sp. NPDC050378]|uniref:3,4-dihydroxy-2-butanone-4-phosphate synthase n=1 Tax=Nocardia sp. NPDC050378 TaxID=3155400 RepID=UPI0033CE96A9
MNENPIETAYPAVTATLGALRAGRMAVVVDEVAGGYRGHLLLAAEHVTGAAITVLGGLGCGLVQVAMPATELDALEIPPADPSGTEAERSRHRVAVTLAAAQAGGICASQRAATLRALIEPGRAATDFTRPGHIFPVGTADDGVLAVPDVPEAAVDIAELAGLRPAAVLCEFIGADGEWPTLAELTELGQAHGFPLVTVRQLLAYRRRELCRVTNHGAARIPVPHGEFQAVGFTDGLGREHVALLHGDPASAPRPLVRLHFECILGDVLGALSCGCRDALDAAMRRIVETGCGALIYIRAGKTAIGDTLRAGGHVGNATFQQPHPVGHSDLQSAFDILDELGMREIRLLTEPGETYAVPAHVHVVQHLALSGRRLESRLLGQAQVQREDPSSILER